MGAPVQRSSSVKRAADAATERAQQLTSQGAAIARPVSAPPARPHPRAAAGTSTGFTEMDYIRALEQKVNTLQRSLQAVGLGGAAADGAPRPVSAPPPGTIDRSAPTMASRDPELDPELIKAINPPSGGRGRTAGAQTYLDHSDGAAGAFEGARLPLSDKVPHLRRAGLNRNNQLD